MTRRSLNLPKNDSTAVDVMMSSVQQRCQTNEISSNYLSINGLSSTCLQAESLGNSVKTSQAFHRPQSRVNIEAENAYHLTHLQNNPQSLQYYISESQSHCYSATNQQLFSDDYCHQLNPTSSHINQIDFKGCPPINFAGNGWV